MKRKNGYLRKIFIIFALFFVIGGASAHISTIQTQAATKLTGFVKRNGYWYYYDKNGKKVTGWLTTKSGNKYFFGKDGAAKPGIRSTKGKKYCFTEKGKMLTGWLTVKGKSFYFDSKEGFMWTGWRITSSGKRYYFGKDGVIKTGWQKVDGKIYFFGVKGNAAVSRFITTGKRTYYVDQTGARVLGVQKINGNWYAFHPSIGYLYRSSFYKDKKGFYYLAGANGKLLTGFWTINNKVRYFDPSTCQMATGWKTINGSKYYFRKKDGTRYQNCRLTQGGNLYFFMSNGKLYQKRWFTRNGRYFYAQSDGSLARGWLTYQKNKYYMNLKSGARSSGWVTIENKKYYFSPSTGIMATSQWVDATHYVGADGVYDSSYTRPKLRWPLSSSYNYITSYFGGRESPGGIGSTNHKGIDIAAPTNTPIYAAAAGTVALMQTTAQSNGAGNYTVIDHGKGLKTEYMHQHQFVATLKVGDKVKKGELIGYVGSTGNSTGPHLHFGVISDGVHQDPLSYVTKP